MPGFDGTGPAGYGPRTGRGLGFCRGGLRRGLGRMFGYGPLWSRFSGGNEEEALKDEASRLKEELKIIEDRLNNLNKK